MAHANCGSEPFSYVVVMVDCADRLVVEALYCSDQVVIDGIQPHCCPHSCVQNSVHKDKAKALLVLQVFLTEYSKFAQLWSFLL